MPSLGGYGVAELEPLESQARGFTHGHRKKYAVPCSREHDIVQLFKNKDRTQLHGLLTDMKVALIKCAETLQYESSCLPARQMRQRVLPEKFTRKQQEQSRLDGGAELDGSKRDEIQVTPDECQGHVVLERRCAAAERRPPLHTYSQLSLQGCHQSLMPSYRLPQYIANIRTLDEFGMIEPSTSTVDYHKPIWTMGSRDEPSANGPDGVAQPVAQSDEEYVTGLTATGPDGVAQPVTRFQMLKDASQWALSYCRDFRALHQQNHDHDCTSTCIKYVQKQKSGSLRVTHPSVTVTC